MNSSGDRMETRGEIMRRALAIIDIMAQLRRAHSVNEITRMLNSKLNARYCERTIRRDLIAMHEIGLVNKTIVGKQRTTWKLVLSRTTQHQRAAMELYN